VRARSARSDDRNEYVPDWQHLKVEWSVIVKRGRLRYDRPSKEHVAPGGKSMQVDSQLAEYPLMDLTGISKLTLRFEVVAAV